MFKRLFAMIRYVITIGIPIFVTFHVVDKNNVLYAIVIWLGIALICFNVFTVNDVITLAHQKSFIKKRK